MKSIFAICLLLVTSSCWSQETTKEAAAKPDVEPKLCEELKAFEPFLGFWVFDGKWESGQPLWAKNHYTVGMDGNFVMAKTFTKNEDGKLYQRYLTIWRWDKELGKVVSHGFTNDGSYTETTPTIDLSDESKPAVTSITTTKGSPVALQQTVKLIDANSYSWKVSTSVTKEALIMDGVWKKE